MPVRDVRSLSSSYNSLNIFIEQGHNWETLLYIVLLSFITLFFLELQIR